MNEEELVIKIKSVIQDCDSISDICRKINISAYGGNHSRIKKVISKYNIDDSSISSNAWNKGKTYKGKPHIDIKLYLTENSTYTNSSSLKKKLIKEGIKPNCCEICGFKDRLELHHINGIHNDNRIENLQILCPNCHSKTNNFRGGNKNKSNRSHKTPEELFITKEEANNRYQERKESKRIPEEKHKYKITCNKICKYCGKEYKGKGDFCDIDCYNNYRKLNSKRPEFIEFIRSIKEYKTCMDIGKYYNVSDTMIHKWCKLYSIPSSSKEMYKYACNIVKIIDELNVNF